MGATPRLTERGVRAQVGERSVERARSYVRGGAIVDPRREGATLKALCEGSAPRPYRVQATLKGSGVARADCSCPVGEGGSCKHVAALLLTYLQKPQAFREVEPLDASLERRSKAELVALVKLMIRRAPEVESLVELPLDGGRHGAVSAETIHRQALGAFRTGGEGWGAAATIAEALRPLQEWGEELLAQGDAGGASAVFAGILTAFAEEFELAAQEEGDELHPIAQGCSQALGRCLAALDEPVRREAALRALWALCRADLEFGGIGMADEAQGVLLERCRERERPLVAAWVRDALPKGRSSTDDFLLHELGAFRLALEEKTLDDEGFLRLCREMGLRRELVGRLLRLGRLEEAVTEAQHARDSDLPPLADLFVRHRHGEAAERLVAERAARSDDRRLLEWLKKRASGRKDEAGVRALTEQLFRKDPSLERYRELRRLSGRSPDWPRLRADLIRTLEQKRRVFDLVHLFLDEGELDRALALVQPGAAAPRLGGAWDGELALDVAKAAQRERPRAALEIYRRETERLIGLRSRDFYREACRMLKTVRALYDRLGEQVAWASYLEALRRRHKALRALQEELRAARL